MGSYLGGRTRSPLGGAAFFGVKSVSDACGLGPAGLESNRLFTEVIRRPSGRCRAARCSKATVIIFWFPFVIIAPMVPGDMHCETIDSQSRVCVWIVHPSRLFRECLAAVLSDEVFLVHSVDPQCDPVAAQGHSRPDAVVLDLHLPRQQVLQWIESLKGSAPQCKVILLARAAANDEMLEYMAAGAHGCVVEMGSVDELRSAIRRVLDGEVFCSPAIIKAMFERLAETRPRYAGSAPVEPTSLTARELEVLRLVAQQLSNKEIARKLRISLYTVKNHVHNIVEKLCVEGRYQAVQYARQRRWLPAEVEQG